MQTSTIDMPLDARVSIETPRPVPQRPAEPQPEAQIEHKVDMQELAKLQTALADHNISLKFSRDEATDRIVVQMINENTGEAIRQFPTEVSLHLAANFLRLQGVFIDADR